MKPFKNLLSALLFISLFNACEDRLDVSVEDDILRLVVEGRITEGEEPVEVRLSWTTGFDHGYAPPKVSGALVCIADSEGNCTDLVEVSEGIYRELNSSLQGRKGIAYSIEINLPDGRSYASEPEVLRAAPGIDSSYAEFFYRERLNSSNYIEPVATIQLYVDFYNPLEEDNFLLWEWKGVYEFLPPLAPSQRPCYVSEKNLYSRFNLMTDENFTSTLISRQKIDMIDVNFRFDKRYGVELNQYALSADAYEYFKGLRYQIERSGSISDPPPFRVRGNIRNVADENEVVLGYFYAAGKASDHLFVERNQIPLLSVGEMDCDGPPFGPPPPICENCLADPAGSIEPPSYWKK